MKKILPLFLLPIIVLLLTGVGCDKNTNQNQSSSQVQGTANQTEFVGTKGEKVILLNGQIALPSWAFKDEQAQFYNTELASGKTIYFFVLKDKEGNYRAAANACQVCFDTRMGFHQQGNYMVCKTCGNKYPLEKIATEKGGCNPGPINPNLEVKEGQVIIEESDLGQVAELFS